MRVRTKMVSGRTEKGNSALDSWLDQASRQAGKEEVTKV